jgi:hypothetical protein
VVLPILLALFFAAESLSAQDTLNISFAKLLCGTLASLSTIRFQCRSVILADIGLSYYEANSAGSLGLVFTRFMRVKI